MSGADHNQATAVVDPTHEPGSGPAVLWVAPGSAGADELPGTWARGPAALRAHRGPLGAVLVDGDGATVLATDALGTLPLYWARNDNGRIVVDTVLSRIVDRPDVDDRLDLEGVVICDQPGLRGPDAADRTPFRAVRVVPAGSTVRFRPDGTWSTERHWSPSDVADPDERLTFGDCVDALRGSVDEAVRRAVADDVPTGAHVSGGLDCTSVACRAQMLLAERGRSLVAGYSWAPSEDDVPRFPGDERDLLDDVERALGFSVRRLHQQDTDWWHRRDPARFPASTHFSERHVVATARDDGVEVILSGWGGDELASFNGRGVPTDLIRSGSVRRLARERRRRRTLAGRPDSLLAVTRQMAADTVRALPHPLDHLPHPVTAWRRHRAALEWEAELRAFSPLAADLAADQRRRFSAVHDARSMQEALLTSGHLQHRIQAWHQVGSLFGVSYRYPLLDVGVVETALTLPWWAWMHDGWSRAAYRAAVAPWVPDSVAWNLRKVEPAFLRGSGIGPRRVEDEPEDSWRSNDPGYEAAVVLARSRRWIPVRPAVTPDDRVETRAERAL